MSTYKLWELANRDGVKSLLPYVEDAVLRFSEMTAQSLTPRVPAEVGEPLARYVHGQLLAKSRRLRRSDPTPPDPRYTHVTDINDRDEISLSRIVREATGNVLSDKETAQLAGSIQRHLRYYRLATSTRGSGQLGYFLRFWPPDLKWAHQEYKTLAADPVVEKRIKEEADQPVKVYYRASAVVGEIPEKITPEWAVATIKRMAEAYDSLSQKYQDQSSRLAELEAKVEELSSDPWDSARDELTSALGGNGAKEPEKASS